MINNKMLDFIPLRGGHILNTQIGKGEVGWDDHKVAFYKLII
jgi:hypothetical protein